MPALVRKKKKLRLFLSGGELPEMDHKEFSELIWRHNGYVGQIRASLTHVVSLQYHPLATLKTQRAAFRAEAYLEEILTGLKSRRPRKGEKVL